MIRNLQEAYEKGYADGLCMAERMRWRGTPIGDFLKGSCYRPEREYRTTYDNGFRHAMRDAYRVEWVLPQYGEEADEQERLQNSV